MKVLFLAIVLLHGLIHIAGFIKGWGIKEIKELTLPVSRTMGILWLITAIVTFVYAFTYYMNSRYSWVIGFLVVLLSQTLIIIFWKDAKFGTIPNLLILFVSVMSFSAYKFEQQIKQETNAILSKTNFSTGKIISETDIQNLPDPVKIWLSHSGVIGKPFISSGKVVQKAEMKLKPEQKEWMSATAIQYTTIDNPAFIWTVDLKMNPMLAFRGRDKFENGKGEMLIKLNSLVNVVDEEGSKLDEGTLQRYLGEMVWFPSLAFSPYITWEQIDETSAIATMDYMGTKGSGTFYFNSAGDFYKFSAMRFKDNEKMSQKYEWVLLVDDYKVFEGIKIPAKMTATWKLDDGDWTWLKMEITDLFFNENTFQ
jgi:hypothetical protein